MTNLPNGPQGNPISRRLDESLAGYETDGVVQLDQNQRINCSRAVSAIAEAASVLEGINSESREVDGAGQPASVIMSQLNEALDCIEQARRAIGNPSEDLPVMRVPMSRNRINLGRVNLGVIGVPSEPGSNSEMPLPSGPIGRIGPLSLAAHINISIQHLNAASETLGGGEVTDSEIAPDRLLRCNRELKSAKASVEAAKTALSSSRPNESTQPPRLPIIGGDEDLFPNLSGGAFSRRF